MPKLTNEFENYQMTSVLLNNGLKILKFIPNPKMDYSKFAKIVWSGVFHYLRQNLFKDEFCLFFFNFIKKMFNQDHTQIMQFFMESLNIISSDDSEENKYLSLLFIKKGGVLFNN